MIECLAVDDKRGLIRALWSSFGSQVECSVPLDAVDGALATVCDPRPPLEGRAKLQGKAVDAFFEAPPWLFLDKAAHTAPWTRVLDLKGRAVMPGLVDATPTWIGKD